jgi:hypothetical protein
MSIVNDDQFQDRLVYHVQEAIIKMHNRDMKSATVREKKRFQLRAVNQVLKCSNLFLERFDRWVGPIISFVKATNALQQLCGNTPEDRLRFAFQADASLQFIVRLLFYNLREMDVESLFEQHIVDALTETIAEMKYSLLILKPIDTTKGFIVQTALFLDDFTGGAFHSDYFNSLIDLMISKRCISTNSFQRLKRASKLFGIFKNVHFDGSYEWKPHDPSKIEPSLIWFLYRFLYSREIVIDDCSNYINELGLRLEYLTHQREYVLLTDLCQRYDKKEKPTKITVENETKHAREFEIAEKVDTENKVPIARFVYRDGEDEIDNLADIIRATDGIHLDEDTDEEDLDEQMKAGGFR